MNISIQFKLTTFQPGSRGYNQAIFEPVSDVIVSVDVPVKYLANAEEFIADPLQGKKAPEPVLTVEGWAYVETLFLNRASAEVVKSEEDDTEWEDE